MPHQPKISRRDVQVARDEMLVAVDRLKRDSTKAMGDLSATIEASLAARKARRAHSGVVRIWPSAIPSRASVG